MRFLSQVGDLVSEGGGNKREFVRHVREELSCRVTTKGFDQKQATVGP